VVTCGAGRGVGCGRGVWLCAAPHSLPHGHTAPRPHRTCPSVMGQMGVVELASSPSDSCAASACAASAFTRPTRPPPVPVADNPRLSAAAGLTRRAVASTARATSRLGFLPPTSPARGAKTNAARQYRRFNGQDAAQRRDAVTLSILLGASKVPESDRTRCCRPRCWMLSAKRDSTNKMLSAKMRPTRCCHAFNTAGQD
jgi:hypothetical protein